VVPHASCSSGHRLKAYANNRGDVSGATGAWLAERTIPGTSRAISGSELKSGLVLAWDLELGIWDFRAEGAFVPLHASCFSFSQWIEISSRFAPP
jgi:hypothetical protein